MAHPYSSGPKSLLSQSHHEFSPMLHSRTDRLTDNVHFVAAPVPLAALPIADSQSLSYIIDWYCNPRRDLRTKLTVGGRALEGMTQSRDNFVRLAEARTNRVLKDLDLLGNLSNRSNYSYADDDVRKIFKAVQQKIKTVEGRFISQLQGKSASSFKL